MKVETIEASDGARLSVRVYEGEQQPRGSVVIGGAMGVRQEFYALFANWLAGQGWRVTTFDYRGCGDSGPTGAALRGFKADLFDWTCDYEAAIEHAHTALPAQPLYLLGHSLGAQLPGLLNNQHRITGMLSVAAGSGYWRDNAPQLKRMIFYFWFVLVPLATRLFGYFPGKKLRKVGDVPAGVMLQWRRWCLSPRYSVGAEGEAVRRRYSNARFPIHAISVTDDEMMTLHGTHNLVDLYENAPRAVQRLAPSELGVRRLGHFGAFRSEHEAQLWPRISAWLGALSTPRPA
jgi:predicted alpha/beta hydrolase